jgi:hypothetical protein
MRLFAIAQGATMRKAIVALTILFVACLQVARADVNTSAAPADEYFGPYNQSVLEIRNRLNDYDQCNMSTMLDPSVPAYLDHLQSAIVDWQRKYPRDPWLPRTFAHLVREYWRAGQASSPHGMAALAYMRAAYPDAAETAATVALVYGSNGSLSDVSRDDAPAPVYYASAPSNPAPVAAPALPSYAVADPPAQVQPQAAPVSDIATDVAPEDDSAPPPPQ